MRLLFVCPFLFFNVIYTIQYYSQVNSVRIEKNQNGFELFKNNEPYYIKGAGAKSNFNEVKKAGANSIRIWSTNNKSYLDSAHKYGLTVTLGLWVAQERNGFNYDDEYAVAGQIASLKKDILKLKDHPALLTWGIGNEVDLQYSNFKVWETIEEIAAEYHSNP